MKMYLSSYRLGNNPEKLVALMGKNKKVAVVPNDKEVIIIDPEFD